MTTCLPRTDNAALVEFGSSRPSEMDRPVSPNASGRYEIRINEFLRGGVTHIFNEPAYFQLHASRKDDCYFQLVRRSDTKVCATLAFYAEPQGHFVSPRRGTFGGPSISPDLDVAEVERFIQDVLAHVAELGAHSLEMKCAPFSHDPALSSIVANVLFRAGATLSGFDLNYDLRVDARPLSARMDYGSRKRLQKCMREGFVAAQSDASELGRVYEVIRANRQRRAFPMTMSVSQLQDMLTTFPDRVKLFAVFADTTRTQIVAAAICVAISSSVLYVLYWGDAPDQQSHSPIVLLASEIHEFTRSNAYSILDIGTATVDGAPNFGLAAFKRGLGFNESLKPTYRMWLRR